METDTLIDFWRCVFSVVKERQEQGAPVNYQSVICEGFGLVGGMIGKIPDLSGVDLTDDLVSEWLRQTFLSKEDQKDLLLSQITLPGEIWKTVRGYSRYKVSTYGRVWSCYHGKIMRPQKCGKKYPSLNVRTDEGKMRSVYVHRLVAQTFLPNPSGFDTIDHIDEDHDNNRVDNLRWMSRKENMEAHMRKHGYWYNPDAWHPGKEPKRYACPADTESEKWRNVIDFPDYFVSDQGRVWSVYSGLKTIQSNRSVYLKSGGQMINKSLRGLVAAAFLPPKEDRQVLRYKNGNRADVRACNLYWGLLRPKPVSHKRGRPPGGRLIPSLASADNHSPAFRSAKSES